MSGRKKTRSNAGAGYGYMFHGAFKEKKDAVAKEKKVKGSWVKGTLTNQGHRYLVMSERTNPIKRKRHNPDETLKKAIAAFRKLEQLEAQGKQERAWKLRRQLAKLNTRLDMSMAQLAEHAHGSNPEHGYFSERIDAGGGKGVLIWANTAAGPFHAQPRFNDWEQSGREIGKYQTLETARKKARAYIERNWGGHNPHELLVMGANPHEREFTLPPNSTITIRTNPTNPDRFTSAHARAAGAQYQAPGLIQTGRQKRVAGLVRGTRTRAGKHKYDWVDELGPGGIAPGQNPGISTLLDVASIGTSLPGLLKKKTRKNVELGTYENGVFHPWTRRPNSRQKRALKKQRANPSAEVIREEFTGMPVDRERVAHEGHMPAGDYAQLGKLLKLCVKPRAGGQVLEIRGNNVTVVSDESARQIYFVGGDQDITEALPMFGAQPFLHDPQMYELGEARSIYYQQRKEHVPDPEQDHWRHEFGEETGERPRALFDARHKRILLEGGAYEVRREGIVN